MADGNSEQTPQGQEAQEDAGGGLVKKLFAKKAEAANERRAPEQGVAHIPATVLTVEYVDDSEGMDAALRSMDERLARVGQQVGAMQETQTQLVAAVNQQARDIAKYIESIGRRVDRLYRRATGAEPAAARRVDLSAMEDEIEDAAEFLDEPAALTGSAGVAPEVADDPDHQNAWRIARVLAADLEAYHEDAVKEGVLYGSFYKLLKDPIEKARQTYQQRVSQELVQNYDYFSKALDELIARKRMELENEEQA
jgi:hypothetical protein